ncbi:tetratricopeptide repeat protein [Phenylobacterium terrae]|uniref:Tetratricopeptide repeat protein n=1 Tax=Phenylobacterium terrae TaxID=2665495 RepID=A0ABW4N2Q6_9CAUL
MAKKKAGAAPMLIAAAVVLAAGVAAGVWIWRSGASTAPAAAAAASAGPPALPEGRLRLLRTGVDESRYLALDEMRPGKDRTEVVVLTVASGPRALEGGAGLAVERKAVKCRPQRIFDAAVARYDFEGKLLAGETLAAPRHGRTVNADELELVQAVCAAPLKASDEVFDGYRAAQRAFQTIPETVDKAAASRTDGPHVYAWLCAEASRRGWRKTAPAECDKAVELNPRSAQVRLDRAYMNLERGRHAAARADFDAVLANDPQNPRALFGRGLALAMAGDEAGGRVDRARAFELDPKILRWVEGTYLFTVGTPWRTA